MDNGQLKIENARLPKGWEIKKLKEIANIKYGYTESASLDKIGPKFLRITDIQNGNVNWLNVPYCKINNDEINKYLLKNGDIVFARTGATTGKSYLIKGKIPTAVFASYLIRVQTKNGQLYPHFLYQFFQTAAYWKAVTLGTSGSAQGGVNATKLGELSIPTPPLPEQKRIVAILNKAFTAIDKAKANAEKNLANAKELFESYLNGIFANPGEDWEEKMLGDSNLVEIIDGDRGKNYPTKKDFLEKGFCLFMNTKNVRPDGFEFNTTMFINEVKDNAMGKGKLKRNDVVMTTRGTIGNLGIYNDSVKYDSIRINSGMLIFRPNQKKIISEYLFELFRSSIIKAQIKKHVSGAAQPQLPIKTLVNFSLPVPRYIKRQETIVLELSRLSTETKRLEKIYQQKVADSEELKKSILQKAFEGKL